MNVVIASAEAKWGGFYKFRTTSRITADQLYGSLVQLRQLTGGVLRGLPLRMAVRPLQVCPDGKPTTVYVVHVELAGADVTAIQRKALEIAQFEVANARQLQAAQHEYRQLLPRPRRVSSTTTTRPRSPRSSPRTSSPVCSRRHSRPAAHRAAGAGSPHRHRPRSRSPTGTRRRSPRPRRPRRLEAVVKRINADVARGAQRAAG